MRALVERIMVVDEAGGVREVQVWQDRRPGGTMDDPHATIDGMKDLRLDTGDALNYVDDDTFRDLHGRLYRRIGD